MSEKIEQWILFWRVLILLRDKWLKRLSEKKQGVTLTSFDIRVYITRRVTILAVKSSALYEVAL